MRALSSVAPRLRVTSSECAISAASRIKLRSVTSDRPPNTGTIVLMQDCFDSLTAFRGLPEMLALETGGMTVLQYDRCGQGDSTGFVLGTPPDYDFAQRESEMLQLLLNLVKVDPENTVLVGVGDGGAIALAHATITEPALRGLVLMNPRLVMEQKTLEAMMRLKAHRAEQLEEMHHHGDKAEALFDGYVNMWLSPPVVSMDLFDMRPLCKHLRCPTLVIHATNDEFTTAEAQVEPIEYFSPSTVEVHRMTTLAPGRLPFLKETRKKRSKVAKISVSEEVVGLLARFSTSLFT